MSRDFGRDVPDLENFMQENFGLSFCSLKNVTYKNHSGGIHFWLIASFSCNPLRVKKLHLESWNFVCN